MGSDPTRRPLHLALVPARICRGNRVKIQEEPALAGAAGGRSPASALLHRVYAFLVSPRLAIALLVIVLACCVAGVTFVRGARAGQLIFATVWFNALLVLLALSSGAAFFTRIWKRKLTLVSAGMILFHLSFVALLGGIVYNQLFFFRGVLRLTEGETLPNSEVASYDQVEAGRFFDPARLRGETTLVRMHRDFQLDGEEKRAAYEIAVSDGETRVRKLIYVTEYLDFEGIRYFCSKEGYSVLLTLSAKGGPELYGAHIPLQSYAKADGTYKYATGNASTEVAFTFPPPPEQARADVHLEYRPSTVKDRDGEVTLTVTPLAGAASHPQERVGRVVVGAPFDVEDLSLTPKEIRYWVGMDVRHDPGLALILGSLCFGLGGMALILVGRVRQGTTRRRAVAGAETRGGGATIAGACEEGR